MDIKLKAKKEECGMDIKLKAKKVVVLVRLPGTDEVLITLDGPTPYPAMGYDGDAKIHVQAGYGIKWCREVLGVEPEVIDCKDQGR